MFGSAPFDRVLEKATSNLRLEPDWTAILQICDMIRQGDAAPKAALASIKKKLQNPNPHVVLYALLVLESCVKNCGSLIHDEVGTKAYMEQLKELLKSTPHEDVRNKILELVQAWAYAFRNSPRYRAVPDFVNIMRTDGHKFPVLNESDAMFSADTAPEWVDGDVCHRCRAVFSMIVRKHHCRACGQVFCSQCSSKNISLPKFGIEKEVRVCDDCFEKNTKPSATGGSAAASKSEELLPSEYMNSLLSKQSQEPPVKVSKSKDELKEEEDLQLAIALSQSEAESNKSRPWSTASIPKQEPPPSYSPSEASPSYEESDSNPELAKYLNRSFWEQKKVESAVPSSSRKTSSSASVPVSSGHHSAHLQDQLIYDDKRQHNGSSGYSGGGQLSPDELDSELDDFIRALKSQVEIFVNRMKSNSSRGRSIANDSSVQTLFVNITTMHSRLLKYIQERDDRRVYFEGLQDKLTQVKDARAALDALRDEHNEKLRREAEMAERQKQIQMAHKLDMMRKKKQEYLQYQRKLALQKIQEQEYEMQMRQEQQKQQYMQQKGFFDPSMTSQMYPQQQFQASYTGPHMIPPPGTDLPAAPQPMIPPPGSQAGGGHSGPQPWMSQGSSKPMLAPSLPNQMIPPQLGSGGIMPGQQGTSMAPGQQGNPMVPGQHGNPMMGMHQQMMSHQPGQQQLPNQQSLPTQLMSGGPSVAPQMNQANHPPMGVQSMGGLHQPPPQQQQNSQSVDFKAEPETQELISFD